MAIKSATGPNSIGRTGRRFERCVSGSNAVEFALVAPILFMLILAIVYVSLYLSVAHSLVQLAADASRYAMVGLDKGEREDLARRWVNDTTHRYGVVDNRKLIVSTTETDGAFSVTLGYDMGYMPVPTIVTSVIDLPEVLERSATVLVR